MTRFDIWWDTSCESAGARLRALARHLLVKLLWFDASSGRLLLNDTSSGSHHRVGIRDRIAMSRALLVAAVVAVAGDCRTSPAPERQAAATLATDSAQYAVRFEGGMYRGTIGYVYTNRSGDAVSATHCHTPPPPVLEKKVGEEWVRAYNPVMLACLSIPHFRIAAGTTYRGTLHFAAAPSGRNMAPALEVESIPGTYRLRWGLRAGSDPEARDAPIIEAISNEFRMVER